MQLGILSRTFLRPTLAEMFDAVASHGLASVQLSLPAAGRDALPEALDAGELAAIRAEAGRAGVGLAAVSGTTNMIHPDPAERAAGLRRLHGVIAAAPALGTPIVTLCTGSRDRGSMWRAHPANAEPDAWDDLLAALAPALAAAEAAGVTLGVEPEPGNVIMTAQRARRLLDTFASPHLGIVLDPANLLEHGTPAEARRLLDEAIDLLGGQIVLAHAKDRTQAGTVTPAGTGIVDFGHMLARLREIGYGGPLLIHGLEEAEVPAATDRLRALMG